jgi:uncharacterized membrane protein
MRNQKTTDLVFLSMIISIILVMSYVPNLGFIQVGTVSVTLVHIPVIIAAIFLNRKMGMLAGAFFGLSSLYLAYTRALESPVSIDYLFRDPAISVLPRVLFPLFTALLYENLKKYIKVDALNIYISVVAGALIHSLLVYTALFFFFSNVNYMQNATLITINDNPITNNVLAFVVAAFMGSIVKAFIAGLIATPIIKALQVVSRKNIESNELNSELIME